MASNSSSYGANALKSSGPAMSMVDNMGSIGIGNYKGVMLCNRPFGGTAANKVPTSSGEKTTFNCGVVAEPAGLNVPISAKEKMVKRPNKDSVLAKHKKWLSDLQKTKDRLEAEYLEEARKKEEAQAKFQEHEKKMRLAARSALHSASGDEAVDAKDSKESYREAKDAGYGGSEEEKAQPKGDAGSSSSAAAGAKAGAKAGGAQYKPAWAMTEKAAGDQFEELQLNEEDALLDFAKGLDFDRYIGDVEVQAVMEKLRSRIADLEREVTMEDMRSADAETRAALRAKLEQMGLTEASLADDARSGVQNAESAALVAARALLQEEDDMQAVHSTKSVAALLKAAKDKIAQVKASVQPPSGPSGEPRIANEPIIIVHDPSEGSRLEVKNALSKLPYMNRNPAV